ncbi:MAG: tetratricopeptide (TPR) repeat protein [Arenicella sp.]
MGEKDLVEKIRHAVSVDSFSIIQKELTYQAKTQLTQSNSLSELGLELITKERFEEAEKVFEINSSIFPESKNLGDCLLNLAKQNSTETAAQLTSLRRSYQNVIPNSSCLNTLGKHFLRFGKSEKARNILQLNTLLFPKASDVWESYAKSLLACQDCEKASFYYKKLLEMPIPLELELEQSVRQQLATID